jgi:NADH-quinone oxidoreductase subunit N
MNMTLSGLMPLAPVIIVGLTMVLVMLLVSIKRHHALIGTTTVVGLNAALITIIVQLTQPDAGPAMVSGLFMVDAYALFYQILILVAALACCTLSHAYIEGYKNNREELYMLLLIAVAGAMLMVCSQNLTSFFFSLELLSVPTYGLLAYTHERSKALEAGIKYMVLSATASAAMLMGMAFLYAYTGSMDFKQIGMATRPILASSIGGARCGDDHFCGGL